MTKPIAKGVNHLAKTARQPAGAAATGRNVRCLSHGSNTSEKASRPAPTTATMANSNGQRVVRMRSLRMFVTVWKPISGRNRAKASRAVKPASRSARAISTRWFGAPSAISHLLDIRPAEQALRQEDQGYGEHGKGGDVLVVDGKIGRPHGLDQADQDAADHRARQRADAAQHRGGERLHARHEDVGEADHAVIHQ